MGRPAADIDAVVVGDMRALGFNWVLIASYLGVHINTLSSWRQSSLFDGGDDDPLIEVYLTKLALLGAEAGRCRFWARSE